MESLMEISVEKDLIYRVFLLLQLLSRFKAPLWLRVFGELGNLSNLGYNGRINPRDMKPLFQASTFGGPLLLLMKASCEQTYNGFMLCDFIARAFNTFKISWILGLEVGSYGLIFEICTGWSLLISPLLIWLLIKPLFLFGWNWGKDSRNLGGRIGYSLKGSIWINSNPIMGTAGWLLIYLCSKPWILAGIWFLLNPSGIRDSQGFGLPLLNLSKVFLSSVLFIKGYLLVIVGSIWG